MKSTSFFFTFALLAALNSISPLSAGQASPEVVRGFIGYYETLERASMTNKFSPEFKAVYQAFKAGDTEVDDALLEKIIEEALAFSGVKIDRKRRILL